MSRSQAEREALDSRIHSKVNAHHRAAFADRYPSAVEHSLRLIVERLQLGLEKRGNDDPSDPTTWRLSAADIDHLSAAIERLDKIRERNRD